ncbi:hypothetical protein ED312_20490 [Sinomicrobium pectinilyticum]|uniref:Uncharacterized protein n=1 Tax=Sinomicrobium pectinilyticum TaxID=1084421 RepID=A0A3N0DRB5_SINP1|nr:M20 family metallopeptidase [Sinomicrobium pectinilyticum]RNL77883.1 hypothetical protein ED312_20490 [Sinomicrobium pectinilyticum]
MPFLPFRHRTYPPGEKNRGNHKENLEEQILFTEEVVNINSGTVNHTGVRKTGDIFGKAFREIGFETLWIDMPEEMERAGRLFTEISGKKGKKMLLIGHIYTVFEEDSPFQKMKRVYDSISHGSERVLRPESGSDWIFNIFFTFKAVTISFLRSLISG